MQVTPRPSHPTSLLFSLTLVSLFAFLRPSICGCLAEYENVHPLHGFVCVFFLFVFFAFVFLLGAAWKRYSVIPSTHKGGWLVIRVIPNVKQATVSTCRCEREGEVGQMLRGLY